MYICHCREVTDRCVLAAIEAGARDAATLANHCGAGASCGGCVPALRALLASYGLTTETSKAPADPCAA